MSTIQFTNEGTLRMTTRKQYDGLYRLTSIGSTNGVAGVLSSHAYTYNSANQRTNAMREDNAYWVYDYDSLGQVKSGKKYWSDGTPVAGQQFEYTYDDIGNRKTAASGGDQWGANLRYENYTANNLNQYTARTVPGAVDVLGAANSNATVTVNLLATTRKGEYFRAEVPVTNSVLPAYAGLTNVGVLANGANPDIVTTNLGFALVPKASETFSYDLDGNLLTDSLWTNAWSAENRLIAVGSASGVTTNAWMRETWSYRSDGRWSERVVSAWNGTSYVPQFTNRFVWDRRVLLAILDTANAVTMSFMRGLDLSGSRQGAGGNGGALAITIATNGTHFYAYDGNANITGLTSASDGIRSAVYEFDPFARPLRASGVVALANPLRFSCQYFDDLTGDTAYLFRRLRPSLARWLNRDPIGERGGFNLFTINRNASLNAVDFNGHSAVVGVKGSVPAIGGFLVD